MTCNCTPVADYKTCPDCGHWSGHFPDCERRPVADETQHPPSPSCSPRSCGQDPVADETQPSYGPGGGLEGTGLSNAPVADETNAGGLTDAERERGFPNGNGILLFNEIEVEGIVAERVRVAVEQRDDYERVLTEAAQNHQNRANRERAARLALVAGIRGVIDPMGDPMDPKHLHPQAASLIFMIRALLSPE